MDVGIIVVVVWTPPSSGPAEAAADLCTGNGTMNDTGHGQSEAVLLCTFSAEWSEVELNCAYSDAAPMNAAPMKFGAEHHQPWYFHGAGSMQ